MDNTLTAVLIGAGVTLIGSLLTFLGNYLSHIYTLKREEKQWERQQEAEKERFTRETEKAKEEQVKARKEQISQIYQNCIHYLSILIAEDTEEDTPKITGDKRVQAIEEAQRWLSLLALRVGDQLQFDSYLSSFTSHPDNNVYSLREKVIEIAAQDK